MPAGYSSTLHISSDSYFAFAQCFKGAKKKAEITKLKKACTHQTKACIKEDVMLVSRNFC